MPSLRDSALIYKAKKELFDLPKIPVDIEIKTGLFKGKDGKDIEYSFVEIDGWKYAVPGKIMSQIQMVLQSRPTTKFIKIQKAPSGETYVMPLD